jgi:hypothetical protein
VILADAFRAEIDQLVGLHIHPGPPDLAWIWHGLGAED